MLNLNISKSGPFFDGAMDKAIQDFELAAEEAIAVEGAQLVKERLHEVLKHPTGRYESKIHVDLVQGSYLVTDGGFVTGPWLEGVGSRNKTTRFKGYATFRKITDLLRSRAGEIAEKVLPKFLERMN